MFVHGRSQRSVSSYTVTRGVQSSPCQGSTELPSIPVSSVSHTPHVIAGWIQNSSDTLNFDKDLRG